MPLTGYTEALIDLPLTQLESWVEHSTETNARIVEGELCDLIQKAALLHRYLEARRLGSNHAAAASSANRRLGQIRKGLGYSYPAAGKISF
jgi:hypothetical protein